MIQVVAFHGSRASFQHISVPLRTPLLPREYDDARREDEDRVGGCVLFCGVNLHGFHEQVLAVAFNEHSRSPLCHMVTVPFVKSSAGISA